MEVRLSALSDHPLSVIAESETKLAKKLTKYQTEMEEIKAKAEEREAASEHNLRVHEIMERGVTFFHIAIAIIAICLLTKRRAFFALSLGLGGVGVWFFIQGLLLHVR